MGSRLYVGGAAAAWLGMLLVVGLGHRTAGEGGEQVSRPASVGPPASAIEGAAVSGPRWSLRVDGWTIQLDGVVRQAIPELEPELVPPVLSPYDQMIARHAEAAGLDWRFVSAVIYEESRFEADSRSPVGAVGLMQVMPAAAQDVGELRFHEPEGNVRAGVRYLQRLWREYAAAAERDRLALMLAAYNMGMGHVRDAQRLAGRFGYDPLRWDGAMEVMVALLEEPQVAAATRHGFAQGRSVVGYVERILTRYASYRRTLPAVMPATVAAG
jgi:soluble lytic murein transglycosylase-like protein